MSNARTIAVAAYHAAVAAPVAADWPSVAALLLACLPKLRAAPKPAVASDGAAPAWWADYAPGKRYVPTSADVEFADGRTIRVTIASNPGKPLNIGRAIRTAVAFYRSRVHADVGAPEMSGASTVAAWNAHVAVPAIESVHVPSTGLAFDPLECSRMTAELRAGTWSHDEARAEAEAAGGPAPLPWPQCVGQPRTTDDVVRESYRAAWRAAYQSAEDARRTDGARVVPVPAGESDCERMARLFGGTWRLDADGKAMRCHAAPGIIWTGEGEQYGDDSDYAAAALVETYRQAAIPTREEHEARRAADREAYAEARAAAWCEAVADDYGQPGAFTIGETWEAGARPADAPTVAAAPAPVEPGPAPAAPITPPSPVDAPSTPPLAAIPTASVEIGCEAPYATGSEILLDLTTGDATLIPAATIVSPDLNADPADAMPICPSVGLPCRAACSHRHNCGTPVDPTYDAPEANAETHPVVALCLSDKARARLFDRIQDGTFPAADRMAKGGAWRLTVADALDCQDIGSLRLLGLPRKPYTRRAACTPLDAMPVVGIPSDISLPAGAFIPCTPPGPVIYHAAPTL